MLRMIVNHFRVRNLYFNAYKTARRLGLSRHASEVFADRLAVRKFTKFPDHFAPCGGQTLVGVYNDDDDMVCSGSADCSLEDNYNKKTGIKIALKRAILNGNLSADEWLPLARTYGTEYVQEIFSALSGA